MNNGSQDMPMDMPPMDMSQDMGNDMGGNFMPQGDMGGMPMDNGMGMSMDNGMGGADGQFDTNFDAGVEADEEQDPKKFIQQLTGKLSQSLRKFNDDNGQPDVDLNKYVAGMIVKQAMNGLSQEDADEIIDKVKADEDFTMDDNQQGDAMPQMPQDDEQMMADPNQQQMPMGNGQQQMNENSRKKRHIQEIVNGVLDTMKNDKPYQQKPKKGKDGYNKQPYGSRQFD